MRQPACLPTATARLLFDHALTYETETLALSFPGRHLRRPVLPKGGDVDRFLDRLVPRTVGADKVSAGLTTLVLKMLQAETRQSAPAAKFADIAQSLGLSEATLRRRLSREGATFRQIKEGRTR